MLFRLSSFGRKIAIGNVRFLHKNPIYFARAARQVKPEDRPVKVTTFKFSNMSEKIWSSSKVDLENKTIIFSTSEVCSVWQKEFENVKSESRWRPFLKIGKITIGSGIISGGLLYLLSSNFLVASIVGGCFSFEVGLWFILSLRWFPTVINIHALFDHKTGEVSFLVSSRGISMNPKIFINIPPNCGDIFVAKPEQADDLIKKADLLINNPSPIIEKVFLEVVQKLNNQQPLQNILVRQRLGNGLGVIIINQPLDMNSLLGPLDGMVIRLPEDAPDKIRAFAKSERGEALKHTTLGQKMFQEFKN